MTVEAMNEEMLMEIKIADIKNAAKKISKSVSDAMKSTTDTIKDEFNDNIEAFKIFKRKFVSLFSDKSTPTPQEIKAALDQILKDNPRLLLIGGISTTPGSSITLPVALKVAKEFGIALAPKKTFV